MTFCFCFLLGIAALMICAFGDSIGSYDALTGNTWSHLNRDDSTDHWAEYVRSCNIDGDLSEKANGALGLFLGAFSMIVIFTIWTLSISRGCRFCCSPCDNRDRACCANTLLAFCVIFLVFSMGFLLWMITLMSLDKWSCNSCHNSNAKLGTVNSILNSPEDCVKQNYAEVERSGIATLGGFFGLLALCFAGLYCIYCHPPPQPKPPPKKVESIPLHLIRDDDEEAQRLIGKGDRDLYSSHDAPPPGGIQERMYYNMPHEQSHVMDPGFMSMEGSYVGQPELLYGSGYPHNSRIQYAGDDREASM